MFIIVDNISFTLSFFKKRQENVIHFLRIRKKKKLDVHVWAEAVTFLLNELSAQGHPNPGASPL
jgi:hypothetical protein